MWRAVFRVIAGSVLLLLLASCASTRITGEWRDAAYDKSISKILVVGMSANTVLRRSYEDSLVSHFNDHGVEAVSGATILPEDKEVSKETIKKAVEGKGFDAVLVTRLVGVDEQHTYVSTSDYAPPAPYYRNFYDYYNRTYPTVYRRDYLVTDTIVTLETNIYDVETGNLIWAITSESFNPDQANDLAKYLSDIIVDKLAKEGLI